jgi:hypothetical protein
VAGFTIGLRGKVPGKRKPVIENDSGGGGSYNNNNNTNKVSGKYSKCTHMQYCFFTKRNYLYTLQHDIYKIKVRTLHFSYLYFIPI